MHMKSAILFLTIFCAGLYTYGQTTVNYNYDRSGNRTSHKTISFKSTSTTSNETQSSESLSEQIGSHDILIYPNPVQSNIIVEIQGMSESTLARISIVDQGGRLVLVRENISGRNTLDLSNLPTGTYFLIIYLDDGNTQWTIVKE